MISLYVVTNKLNGKQYVGMTSRSMRQRRWEHLSAARNDSQYHFHKALRKYGEDSFEWEVVAQTLAHDDACESERRLIEQQRPAYNLTVGGEGVSCGPLTGARLEKARSSIAKALEVRWQEPQARQLASQCSTATWQDPEIRERREEGIRRAAATRDYSAFGYKISASLTGRTISDETKAKLSAANFGVKQEPEHVLKRVLGQCAGNIARAQGWLPKTVQQKARAPISNETRTRMQLAATLREGIKNGKIDLWLAVAS